MSSAEFLLLVRGPLLSAALAVFAFGMALKLFEILMLGRRKNLAKLRSSGIGAGFRTIITRSIPADHNTLKRSLFMVVAGYAFHIGLFVVLFLLTPHILLIQSLTGLSWPGLPTPLVDLFAVIAMVALLALLWRRLTHPVLKFLSTGGDYLVWTLSFVPLLTGYMAYHHLFFPYTMLLALHILSVELLLVLFPFTKLTHTFTLFLSRWYNGSIAGQKGVQS